MITVLEMNIRPDGVKMVKCEGSRNSKFEITFEEFVKDIDGGDYSIELINE